MTTTVWFCHFGKGRRRGGEKNKKVDRWIASKDGEYERAWMLMWLILACWMFNVCLLGIDATFVMTVRFDERPVNFLDWKLKP